MAELSSEDAEVMIELAAEAIADRHPLWSFRDVRDTAGKILCFVFSPSKPPSYSQAMAEAREQFAGLADDDDIRLEFQHQIQALAEDGRLDSVEAAVNSQIWQDLGRGAAMTAGA